MASALFGGVLLLVVGLLLVREVRSRPLQRLLNRRAAVEDRTVLLFALLVFDTACVGLLARFGAQLP